MLGRGLLHGSEHVRVVEHSGVYDCGLAHVLEVLVLATRPGGARNTDAAGVSEYTMLTCANSMLGHRVQSQAEGFCKLAWWT